MAGLAWAEEEEEEEGIVGLLTAEGEGCEQEVCPTDAACMRKNRMYLYNGGASRASNFNFGDGLRRHRGGLLNAEGG